MDDPRLINQLRRRCLMLSLRFADRLPEDGDDCLRAAVRAAPSLIQFVIASTPFRDNAVDALDFATARASTYACPRTVAAVLDLAARYFLFIVNGDLSSGFDQLISDVEPDSEDILLTCGVMREFLLPGDDRCRQGGSGLVENGALQPFDAGSQNVAEFIGHDESSVGCVEAATVGDGGRIGNDLAAGAGI